VVIVSSDKDMMQLVTERVSMLNPAKDDEWYNPEKVKEFLGVRPEQVADLLALKGDAVDNIPGAPGIGDKGAKDLIERFGSAEAALEHAAEVERKAYREGLQNHAEQVRQSKRLATISTDVPVPFSPESVKAQPVDAALLKALYTELEFHSLLKELGPGEDTRARDYRVVESAEELKAWLEAAAGAPVAVAPSKSGRGRIRAGHGGPRVARGRGARGDGGVPAAPQRVARGRRRGEGGVRREIGAAGAGPAGH
jgi:DNA polymerase-1